MFYNEYQLYYYIRLFFAFLMLLLLFTWSSHYACHLSHFLLFFAVRCVLVYMLVIFSLFSPSLCECTHNACKPSHTTCTALSFFFCCSSMAPRRLSSRNSFFFCLVLAHFLPFILYFFFSLDYNLKQTWSTSGLIGAFFFQKMKTKKKKENALINVLC